MLPEEPRGTGLTVPAGLQLGQQLLGGQQVSTLHRLEELLLLPHPPPPPGI